MENQLRSWKPRPASARLKVRLFPARLWQASGGAESQACDAEEAPSKVGWGWLAPALALFMGTMFLAGPGTPGHLPLQLVYSPHPALAQSIREPSLGAYVADAVHSPRNNCQNATFEWTNPHPSLTTAGPVPGTNALLH